jgi:uncharacterized protein YggU (UPF0235/DUF167 family)
MKLTVIAHPNARRPRIEEDLLGTIHVYVNAPPLEGKANKAVLEALATHLGVKKSQLELVSGATSKMKVFTVAI